MLKSLFVFGVLGVLLIPAEGQQITVCLEDDDDLRVDCLIEPKPNKINSYEFTWSINSKEAIIYTNVSGSAPDSRFKGKAEVVELLPHGYRMTLEGFTETLPHNTTYMCKVSGEPASVTKENAQLPRCSAVSVFLKSSFSWIVCLLVSFYQTRS